MLFIQIIEKIPSIANIALCQLFVIIFTVDFSQTQSMRNSHSLLFTQCFVLVIEIRKLYYWHNPGVNISHYFGILGKSFLMKNANDFVESTSFSLTFGNGFLGFH